MTGTILSETILRSFPHAPTDDQRFALQALSEFLTSRETDSLLLLKGSAGTGKTSLVGALVKVWTELKQKVVLLAPTGRAAKVFSLYAGHKAWTIHKKIYRQKTFSHEMAGFLLDENRHKDTLFIVDEASMIANDDSETPANRFGSGRLLDDLIQYVYAGENCRLILMGDEAQLPPVGHTQSPALDGATLRGYHLCVQEVNLAQVVRQSEASDILCNAVRLRDALSTQTTDRFPALHLTPTGDCRKIGGEELLEALSTAYARDGLEETIVIVRSNKRANRYNNGIRAQILYRENELESGDRLMITKNNYYWTIDHPETDFIANGEIIEVLRVRAIRELYGFRFADVTVRFQDYDLETDLKILLDTLQAEAPTLPKAQSDHLFHAVWDDYADVPAKAARMKKIKTDPYYNVVQVKYAYAITCHKAQGGQWKNVFLDVGAVSDATPDDDFYRWLYTAFTRATQRLYLINLPDVFDT